MGQLQDVSMIVFEKIGVLASRFLFFQKFIIRKSGMFDEGFYLSQIPQSIPRYKLLDHFLKIGCEQGLKPNADFDPAFYCEMYADVKRSKLNPFCHYVMYGAEEGRFYNRKVHRISTVSHDLRDLAIDFDQNFYLKAYPDISELKLDPWYHFIHWGLDEGRLAHEPKITKNQLDKFDSCKKTVIIVSHEASRSGAPILSLNLITTLKKKYNVISLTLSGGKLSENLRQASDLSLIYEKRTTSLLKIKEDVREIQGFLTIEYAIVNSVVSASIIPYLSALFIPTICLIHEFSTYIDKFGDMVEAIKWADETVFSANIVLENAIERNACLKGYSGTILPQGRSIIPPKLSRVKGEDDRSFQHCFKPEKINGGTVIILGVGGVELRKGCDLFIHTAAKVIEMQPNNVFHFVWVGPGYDPDNDIEYSVFLKDQIKRSGADDYISFVGELSELESAYLMSDVFFLSSRLDPLPNVAIDSMIKGLPVVCFENTSGIADILLENGLRSECVATYLDIESAAAKLKALIDDKDYRDRVGSRLSEIGSTMFNMEEYANKLDSIALTKVKEKEKEKHEYEYLLSHNAIDLSFFSPDEVSEQEAACTYIRTWRNKIGCRKPFSGFHPGIYEEGNFKDQTCKNALVDFLENGKRKGPWNYDVLVPRVIVGKKNISLKVAIHIHAFYDDLFIELYDRIKKIEFELDLLISVPATGISNTTKELLRDYKKGKVIIETVPNRGRDIGPLITKFGSLIIENYDIIGHLYTKKSADVRSSEAMNKWNDFLLENLLGGMHDMVSVILEEFQKDPLLGLVYPDDPNIFGWSDNKKIVDGLADLFKMTNLPDDHFNFPVGNMFWARTKAIRLLLEHQFTWDDYPAEPLACDCDSTLLHAIERILPSLVLKAGYKQKVTYVPGVTR